MKPEEISYKIYSFFTEFRVLLFYALLIFIFINLIVPNLELPFVSQKTFFAASSAMANISLTMGGVVATLITIVLEIIRKKEKSDDVTNLWLKFAKYIIHPFAVAIFINLVLFLKEVNYIIKINTFFSLLLLFGFLMVNNVYIIIKATEELINEDWMKKNNTKEFKTTQSKIFFSIKSKTHFSSKNKDYDID